MAVVGGKMTLVGVNGQVWVGGSMVEPQEGGGGGGGGVHKGGGAAIQPLDKWYIYGAGSGLSSTLQRELTSQAAELLHSRAAKVPPPAPESPTHPLTQNHIRESEINTTTGQPSVLCMVLCMSWCVDSEFRWFGQVAAIGDDSTGWKARQAAVVANFTTGQSACPLTFRCLSLTFR